LKEKKKIKYEGLDEERLLARKIFKYVLNKWKSQVLKELACI